MGESSGTDAPGQSTRAMVVDTEHGPGRLHLYPAPAPEAVLLASHGAGGGVDARDLVALASGLPDHGISVALLEQPWRVAGRRIATAPTTLDSAFVTAAKRLGEVFPTHVPLVVAGRSAGARSACRTAGVLRAAGCLAVSFPLHPPGKPERSRLEELTRTDCPTLVVQGARDPMGRPEEFPQDRPGLDLAVIPGGDHGLKVPARGPLSQAEATAMVVRAAREWILREVVRGGDAG